MEMEQINKHGRTERILTNIVRVDKDPLGRDVLFFENRGYCKIPLGHRLIHTKKTSIN